jgi:hypothetical protein
VLVKQEYGDNMALKSTIIPLRFTEIIQEITGRGKKKVKLSP